MVGTGEVNYVHDAEIWRQQMKNEVEVAATWHDNWGFLTGREPPPPRGFSQNVAKYAYGQGKWSVKSVRVQDDTEEGVAAAVSEQNARKMMSSLTCDTKPVTSVKPCEAQVSVSGDAATSQNFERFPRASPCRGSRWCAMMSMEYHIVKLHY